MSECLLTVLAVVSMLAVGFFYRQGLKDGRALEERKPLAKLMERSRPPKPSAEEAKARKLLENVERYNGTSQGQEAIE